MTHELPRAWFLLLPDLHSLDFGGPCQALYESGGYRVGYVGPESSVRSAQGFTIGAIEPLPEVGPDDWVLIPGTESQHLASLRPPVDWLRHAAAAGARISSICTGAFTLAASGLLDGRTCTTHWRAIEALRAAAPNAEVLDARIFVEDGSLVTSAGVAAGIDMALAMIERDLGPEVAGRTAREMVIYLRRDGDANQLSVFLRFRAHGHPAVHRVQDAIVEAPDRSLSIDELADRAALSPRHLTRVFRQATGITIKEFAQRVKLELARQLIDDPALGVDAIAERCGFMDARQLRRLWHRHYGHSPRGERP